MHTSENAPNLSGLGRALLESGSSKPSSGPWVPPTAEELHAILPQYEIVKMLGRGGMGAVYMGRQTALDRPVAIKILSAQLEESDLGFTERFKNEARAMGKLNHPAIVSVYEFGEHESGLLYIVMEYVDGTDVARMIAKSGRLHTEHAMAITAHVCDALAYAHERGIIHRDIKPANIMVGYDGEVKVADFGLAKVSSANGSSLGLTQSGMAMGTLHFMAPEALMLGTAVDHRADIYAVGVMLYQMLTGKLPQGMFKLPSLLVPGLDPRYDAIVRKALMEDREVRYQNIRDMRTELDSILTQPVVKVEPAANAANAQAAALPTGARPQRPGGKPPAPAASTSAQTISHERERGSLAWLWVTLLIGASVAGWMYFERDRTATPAEQSAASAASAAAPAPVVATSPANDFHLKIDDAFMKAHVLGTSWKTSYKNDPRHDTLEFNSTGNGVVKTASVGGQQQAVWSIDAGGRSLKLSTLDRSGFYFSIAFISPSEAMVEFFKVPPAKMVGTMMKQGVSPVTTPSSQTAKTASALPRPNSAPEPPATLVETFNGHRYQFVPGALTWKEAKAKAESMGGHLATLTTKEENEWLLLTYRKLLTTQNRNIWLGASEDMAGLGWKWVTGEPFTPLGWFPGEPNGKQGGGGQVGHPFMLNLYSFKDGAVGWNDSSTHFSQSRDNIGFIVEWDAENPATPAPSVTTAASATTWIDTKGRSLQAKFVRLEGGNVMLDIAGKITLVPLSTLSPASQGIARQLQASPRDANTAPDWLIGQWHQTNDGKSFPIHLLDFKADHTASFAGGSLRTTGQWSFANEAVSITWSNGSRYRIEVPANKPSNDLQGIIYDIDGRAGHNTPLRMQKVVKDTDSGWLPLFPNDSLADWTGDTSAYRVSGGVLTGTGKGDLISPKELGHFHLKFDLRLSAETNSGIGIWREPVTGSTVGAPRGFEVQIQDDTAPKYSKQEFWQRHAGIYYFKEPLVLAMGPVGSWNTHEIRVEGTQVQVIINGKLVQDADVTRLQPQTSRAPALNVSRRSGHLVLLGRNGAAEFRNMQIKELP